MVQADGQHAKASTLLQGLVLDGGWKVIEILKRVPGATGGNFSTPYLVERIDESGTVHHAFLKALDFSAAVDMAMPIADAFRYLTNAYVFERDLVLMCSQKRMTNVIVGLGAGQVRVTDPTVNPLLVDVPYIIFEEADGGDVRSQLIARAGVFDEAWAYRTCHGVANGLRQLHQEGISHQDVKPSNVMSVGDCAKVGDLGRAALRDHTGIFDGPMFAGDINYAPPECLYRWAEPDHWKRVRQNDMYQLGSLLTFLLTGIGMTALLQNHLPATFHWTTWPNDYPNVLPYVRNAFDDTCSHIEADSPAPHRYEALRLVRAMCDPDPSRRGWSSSTEAQRLSMERSVSHLDRVARLAEMDLRRGSR